MIANRRTLSRALVTLVGFCGATLMACGDDTQTSGETTSSSSASSGSGNAMSLPAEGGIGDTCAPNDGSAVDFTIGVPVACDTVPSGPQFRFYAYPGDTQALVVGQMWAFDATTMGQMGSGTFYPDGIGGNGDKLQSASIRVDAVGAATVDVHYEFVTSMGVQYAGDATLTVCPSTPMCG